MFIRGKLKIKFVSETWVSYEVFGMQDSRAHSMHRHIDGPCAVHVQADFQGRGSQAVSGADHHSPPLGPPPLREGQVQGLR